MVVVVFPAMVDEVVMAMMMMKNDIVISVCKRGWCIEERDFFMLCFWGEREWW